MPARSADPTDLRLAHPLTPLDTYVTITDALRRVLDHGGALQTVTLVPVSITPRRAERRPAPDLQHFADVTLRASRRGTRFAYLKLRDRASYEFALASAAVVADVVDNKFDRVRIPLRGVGTKP